MDAVYGAATRKRHLKDAPDNYRNLRGCPGFLNIKALDEIISEPERTDEGFVLASNRREKRICSLAIFFASLSRFNYVEFL